MNTSSFRRGKGQSGLYQMKPRIRVFPEGSFRFSITNSGSTLYGYGNSIEGAMHNAIDNKKMVDAFLDTIMDDFCDLSVRSIKETVPRLKRMLSWMRERISKI